LAVLGDGSSLYSIQGLWTAVQQRVNVTFVIFDNGQYGALRALANAAGYAKVPGTELGGTDFCALARAWNCPAEDISDPADLAPTLRTALATAGPSLVRVALSADYQALY
jgi:benzoylformate decarboxylase